MPLLVCYCYAESHNRLGTRRTTAACVSDRLRWTVIEMHACLANSAIQNWGHFLQKQMVRGNAWLGCCVAGSFRCVVGGRVAIGGREWVWVTLHPSRHDSSVSVTSYNKHACSESETVIEKSSSDKYYTIYLYPDDGRITDAQCWCVNGKKVQQQQASRPANGGIMHWASVSVSVSVREHQREFGSWHCLAVHRKHCTHACWKCPSTCTCVPFAPFVYTPSILS